MATEEFARVKTAQDSSANKKYNEKNAQLKAQFQELFPYYDFDASVKAGELVKKGAPGSTQEPVYDDAIMREARKNKATETAVVDPESISAARMRIMNQYLPMTGSEDPAQSPEQRYYQASLEKMEIQNQALKKQIEALQKIEQKI